MPALLIATSVISSLAAAVLCVIVIRLLREERRRSDARVEALMAMATRDGEGEAPAVGGAVAMSLREEYDSVPQLTAGTSMAVEPTFLPAESPSPWGRRLAFGAGLAALIAAIALGAGAGWSGNDAERGSAPAESQTASLELLSLTHAVEGNALTIRGVVQNPRGGRELADVRAVAHLLDQRGETVATIGAPLDFRRLAAGAESPFVMTTAMSNRVRRYRIGFRDPRGAVIAHVDRRAGVPVARRD